MLPTAHALKNFYQRPGQLRAGDAFARSLFAQVRGILYVLALAVLSGGCATFSKPLPPINLQAPGWTVRQGQAVWKLPVKGDHDIAGEVLVATGPGDQTFVQFSKTPFPILIGQTSGNHWQAELPPQNKRYAGPGLPPKRLIWLYLPRALAGKSLPANWRWTDSGSEWRLENQKTGEAITGFFGQ
jgi:hypothetical protein